MIIETPPAGMTSGASLIGPSRLCGCGRGRGRSFSRRPRHGRAHAVTAPKGGPIFVACRTSLAPPGGHSPRSSRMLLAKEGPDGSDTSSIVSWLPHGQSFVTQNLTAFVAQILPEHFRQTKFSCFRRRLDLYRFSQISGGAGVRAYHCPLFLRDRPDLCTAMRRQKIKGTGHKQSADVGCEPNFCTMPHRPENPTGTSGPSAATAPGNGREGQKVRETTRPDNDDHQIDRAFALRRNF